jgi:hypothetical protein
MHFITLSSNVFMSATPTVLDCFYSHTTIIIMVSKHLLPSTHQFLIPEKNIIHSKKRVRALPFSNSFYTAWDLSVQLSYF